MEIQDQRKVPVLKFRVRRSPFRPLPPWAEATLGGLAQAWLAARYEARGEAEKCGEVGTNPECAPESTDSTLTSRSRIRIGAPKTYDAHSRRPGRCALAG